MAFGLHVAEEAPAFTAWARRNTSPRYTQRDFVRNNALGLAMTAGATYAVSRSRSRSLFVVYWSVVLTQEAVFNSAFHAGTTITYREYSPGVVTSLALFLPLWARVTRLARREGLLTRRAAVAGSALGGAIHAGAVAQQVFFIGVPHDRALHRSTGRG